MAPKLSSPRESSGTRIGPILACVSQESAVFTRIPFGLVLTLLALTASPTSAWAQDKARAVVVVDTSEDTSEHARVAHDVRRALNKRTDYKLMQIHGALNAGDEVEAQNDIKTAQGFHEAGQNSFDAGEVEDASEQFESAARLMEKSFATLTDITEYRALLLRLGEARLATGDRRGAAGASEEANETQEKPIGTRTAT